MAFSAHGSGDLIADRRFAWGEAAFAERDFAAACDLYTQVLAITPDWPPAYWKLGLALLECGAPDAAREAFVACRQRDPEDRLGAGLQLARLDGRMVSPGEAYVRALFDDYAPRFDAHLQEALAYRAPALLARALIETCARLDRPARFGPTLDLGCGTGLMAKALLEADIVASPLVGIDLSAAMLARAGGTGLYQQLEQAEIVDFLASEPAGRHALVLAADVFCYIADLSPVLVAARRVLRPAGLLAFTIQTHEGDGACIGADLRVHHGLEHVSQRAREAGFVIAREEVASARLDRGQPVPGAIFVLAPA